MAVYLLKDTVRIDGATGLCLETGESLPALDRLTLIAPRGGFASFQIIVDGKADAIDVSFSNLKGAGERNASAFEAYVEWFHQKDGALIPDLLVPLGNQRLPFRVPLRETLPQKAGALWVDVYVPEDAQPGRYAAEAAVTVDGVKTILCIELKAYATVLPRGSTITADLNNYADNISPNFPHLANNPNRYADGSFNEVEAQFVSMAREHRALFHNLNYRHSGSVTPGFAPELEGEGKNIRVKSWEAFDAHYAPYFDGTLFEGSRVSEAPIEFCYLPFSFLWPANYEKWGQKGYKTECRRILAEFIRHFEEKGWTKTVFDLLLNHKKDYRYVPYTVDEIWYEHDEESVDIFQEVIEGILDHTDVKIVWRMDSSNHYGNHFEHRYADWCKMWVAGWLMLGWFPESVAAMKNRGNILWLYGGVLREMDLPLTSVGVWPLTALMVGIDGFCAWNTTGFGEDYLTLPRASGGECIYYPGVEFGIDGPVPSIRLKALRNAMQVADAAKTVSGAPEMRKIQAIINRNFGFNDMEDWFCKKPPFLHEPPRYWKFDESMGQYSHPPLNEGRSVDLIADIADEVYALLSGERPEKDIVKAGIVYQ